MQISTTTATYVWGKWQQNLAPTPKDNIHSNIHQLSITLLP